MATPAETADQVAKAKLALEAAEAEHAAAIAGVDENLNVEQLTQNLLQAIVMRLGNRPAMAALLKRIQGKLAPPAAPPADAPAVQP